MGEYTDAWGCRFEVLEPGVIGEVKDAPLAVEEIARRYKGQITFWGEVSRQDTLPFGTPEDCRAAVRRVRAALDDGAGGLIAECEWGNDVAAENVYAVYAAWEEEI